MTSLTPDITSPFNRPARMIKALLAFAILCLCATAQAGKPRDITASEMAILPRYCVDTMGFKYGDAYHNTSPNAPRWVAMMGPGFWHMHHHCWALIRINRANKASTTPAQRKAHREAALGDFWYVVNNVDADFVLLPEILTWIGRTELVLQRPEKASVAFSKAREIKPDYWPAYSHWAEYLHARGQKKDALEAARAGLQHAPHAKPLRELFFALGGKENDIPAAPASATPENAANHPAKTAPDTVPMPTQSGQSVPTQ